MKLSIIRRVAILVFVCVVSLALAMGFALSSLLTRAASRWEWENTAALARREVSQGGLNAIFTSPGNPRAQEELARELSRRLTSLPDVVRVKVWDREATVLWSDKAELIGRQFPDNREFRAALAGQVAVEIKTLGKAEHAYERGRFGTLAEVYVPIFSSGGEILGVLEVYKSTDRLLATIRRGRMIIWSISLVGGLALYCVLLPLFRYIYRVQEETHRAYAGRLEQEVAERTQELEGKSDRLRTLNRLTRLITSTTKSREVFDAVARAAATLLGAQMARVWVADPAARVLRTQGRFGIDPKFEELMTDLPAIPFGKGVAGGVFESRVPEYLSDIGEDSRWLTPRLASEAGLHAYAGIPLVTGDRTVGVLSILFGERRHFTPEDKELMGLLADQAATALENARLLWESRSRQARLEALLEVNRQLSRLQPVESLLRTIAETCGSLIGSDSVGFRLVEGDELVVVGTWGEGQEVLAERRLKVGESLSGAVAASGEPLFVRDAAADPRLIEEHRVEYRRLGYRAFLGVPVKIGERVLGVLSLRTRREEGFSREDLTVAAAFASQAVIALENSRLYGELRRALEELERSQRRIVEAERLRALGEMAGGVAHDFNNLLAAILGRAQYLLLRLAEGAVAPEEARRSLGVIERAARDGGETVRRLLEFTRATPPLTEMEAVNVPELLASVVAAAQPRWKDEAEARGAHIEVAQDVGSVSPVVGNPAELREVLLNLVFNAIEAMPEGGTLTLSSWAEGGSVYLAVRDTGVGIPEEIRSRIFDPFFTTKGVQSSGLGLSVSYGIIRRHGGEITVESRPGRGTTFTIRLPRREAPAPQREAVPRPAAAGLRVLVVDDEEDVRETLRDLLRAVGHEVYEAGSGPEGLEVLEAQEVELVCTDLGMPRMTGWEVAERVKARWPGLAVALITGWGAGVDPEELKAHGVDFLITKPFEMSEIQRVLAEVARSIGVGR